MKAIIVIPARYGSTRLPGKVLLRQAGKYLVQHTYEQALKAKQSDRVIIATDNRQVFGVAKGFGSAVMMTSKRHHSGTDRIAEVARKLNYSIIVNVQADEPEIDPKIIDRAIILAQAKDVDIATLACPIKSKREIADPNKVKVVIDKKGFAQDFFRTNLTDITNQTRLFRHIGLYAYKKPVLLRLTKLRQTSREKQEKLEQLRALENGFKIKVGIVKSAPVGIDTLKDYQDLIRKYL